MPVSGLKMTRASCAAGFTTGRKPSPRPDRKAGGSSPGSKGEQATCVFTGLKPGTYAVAAFHAENNETQMQYGMFGKPKEGYRFSRNPPSHMGAPAFASAAFDYAGGTQTVPIRLTY